MDNELIKAVMNKDEKSEKRFFTLLAPKVYFVCKRYAQDQHEAKDFLQEVFIRVFEKIKKYDPEKSKIETWVFRLATNRIIEILRKKKRTIRLESYQDFEELIEQEEVASKYSSVELQNAIQKLPEGYKKVLNLFVFEKRSHKEIAQQLKIKESTSRSQFTRSKKMLKEILLKSKQGKNERILV